MKPVSGWWMTPGIGTPSGLGKEITGFPKPIRQALRDRNIIIEAIATGGAVRTYNILLGENRAVGAALIAVDSIK